MQTHKWGMACLILYITFWFASYYVVNNAPMCSIFLISYYSSDVQLGFSVKEKEISVLTYCLP